MSRYTPDELFQVFLKWINLFDFTAIPLRNVYQLSNGVILYKLLSKLSPTYFGISSMNESPSSEYDKNSNIIELKQCLEQFFNDVIDQDIAIDKMIDHNKITSNSYSNQNDPIIIQHYVRLLELVLLCSIKCENKSETIGKMTSLTVSEQQILMNILQILMSNTGFAVNNDNKNEDRNNNENENKNKNINNKKIDTPISTTTSLRRLSIAKYSNRSNKSLLSPFGSKREKIKTKSRINYDFDDKDINLKKEKMRLYEENINLIKERDALKEEYKEQTRNYEKLKNDFNSKQNEFKKEILNKYDKNEKDLKMQIETNEANIRKYHEEIKYNKEEINEYKSALIELQEENNKYSQQLQVINDVNDRKLRELTDELDIASHQSNKAYSMEKQIKTYQIRLESMNDLQNELKKYKSLYTEKEDEINNLNQKIKTIPTLKQQIEKYKKQMIQYKVASIGAGSLSLNDKQIANKIGDLEENIMRLNQENDELKLNLKTARKEIINLETQISENESIEPLIGGISNDISPELQSKISRLESENKRLMRLNATKHTMSDLMDELDTKSRLLQKTENKYKEIQIKWKEITEELENMKVTTAEWMRNSCSPQQYKNTLNQLADLETNVIEKNKYIDGLKKNIDELREYKISSTSKMAQYEGELNRTKQRYGDLYEYAEKQKLRLNQYKKAIEEMNCFESNEKKKNFETQKYFEENKELKDKIKILNQEMNCIQNACMNLLKRQVLCNNNMLSKQRELSDNNTTSQIKRPSTFSFRK